MLHEEFLSAITESNLAALLRNDLLNVESEVVVYEAVLRCAYLMLYDHRSRVRVPLFLHCIK